jgi:hypothetical protein
MVKKAIKLRKPAAVAARQRKGGPMKDRRAPRGNPRQAAKLAVGKVVLDSLHGDADGAKAAFLTAAELSELATVTDASSPIAPPVVVGDRTGWPIRAGYWITVDLPGDWSSRELGAENALAMHQPWIAQVEEIRRGPDWRIGLAVREYRTGHPELEKARHRGEEGVTDTRLRRFVRPEHVRVRKAPAWADKFIEEEQA